MKKVKLSWLLENQKNFGTLLGMCLLFDKNSEDFKFSGFVVVALLDYEENGDTILAITNPQNGLPLAILYCPRDYLVKLLNNCVEFVGKDLESSFVLEK